LDAVRKAVNLVATEQLRRRDGPDKIAVERFTAERLWCYQQRSAGRRRANRGEAGKAGKAGRSVKPAAALKVGDQDP